MDGLGPAPGGLGSRVSTNWNSYSALDEGTIPVEPEKTPEQGYHPTEDLTNRAIKRVRQQALIPDTPVNADLPARLVDAPCLEAREIQTDPYGKGNILFWVNVDAGVSSQA